MSERLIEAISDARVVLKAMRSRAKELGVQGVAEVLTLDLVRELSEISDEELLNLSLFELLKGLVDEDNEAIIVAVLIDIIGRFQRNPEPEKRGADDEGTNYLAFATGKLAQMVRTGKNSSKDLASRNGESKARGGVARTRVMTAFSGATELQDTDIANIGADAYETLIIARWQAEVDETYAWLEATVLGEEAELEQIKEQYTPFLVDDEKFECVVLKGGTKVIVKTQKDITEQQ